jgi:peroxiredoxin
MRSATRCLCALAFAGVAAVSHAAATTGQDLAEAAGAALIGKPAPRIVLKTIDGDDIDLAGLYGRKAVYLKFWATWCVPCRQQMPHFEHAFETTGSDMAVIAVNTGFNDSLDAIKAYRAQLGIKMPIVMDDGSLAGALGLRVTPQHIVIGRDGRILYVGHLADARLDAALVAARAEPAQAVSAQATSPAPRRYQVGDRLPDLSLPTLDGGRFPLDAHDGRPIVLVFLSPWCESYLAESRPAAAAKCRKMREQVSALGDRPGIRLLGIAAGLWATSDDLRDYRTKYAVAMPLTLDTSGDLFREFGITEVPTALMIDRRGRIAQKLSASDAEKPAAVGEAVSAL